MHLLVEVIVVVVVEQLDLNQRNKIYIVQIDLLIKMILIMLKVVAVVFPIQMLLLLVIH